MVLKHFRVDLLCCESSESTYSSSVVAIKMAALLTITDITPPLHTMPKLCDQQLQRGPNPNPKN